jgi:hypothetical protein
MALSNPRKSLLGGIAIMTLAGATAASAQQICFTAFGRSTHFQFASSVPAFKAAGIRNVAGVMFGAGLIPCAGLTHWPLVGAEVSDRQKIVLGFRAMTVAARRCGALDFIVPLSQATLTGPLQVHNDRFDTSNISTLAPAACVPVPLVATQAVPLPEGQKDQFGNGAP